MIKKLVVKEFQVVESQLEKKINEYYSAGEGYSHFQDPETGKYYRPVEGFTVIGDDLSDRFVEVESREE